MSCRSAIKLLKCQRLVGLSKNVGFYGGESKNVLQNANKNSVLASFFHNECFRERKSAYFSSSSSKFLTSDFSSKIDVFKRNYAAEKQPEQTPIPIVDYDYVKKLVESDFPNIIDVRQPDELQTDGKIPMTINIPLGLVPEAFALSPKELSGRYDLEIKSYDDEIIFHCRSGKRSDLACNMARNAGYRNVKNYEGSMLEWTEKTQKKNDC